VAVATPGHTEGQVSLHLPGQGIVFTGDALCSLDPLSGKVGPRFLPDSLNRNPALTRDSLSALSTLDADTLLFGHGDPYKGDVTRAVEQARAADRA
jgi:glyoxylase-like metal-dependent hydrolase (beta-lactamase superfamily II)